MVKFIDFEEINQYGIKKYEERSRSNEVGN